MILFKDTNKERNKKNNIQINIDNKHNEIIKHFEQEKNSLSKLKNKLNQMNKELNKLNIIPKDNITDEQLDQKFKYIDNINEINNKIKQIESNDLINKYYADTGHLLFQYYNKSNNYSNPKLKNSKIYTNDISNDPLSKSILDFFKVDKSNEIPMLNVNTNKSQILDKYLSYVDSKYISDKNKDENIEVCMNCNIQKLIITSEGLMICPKCGAQEYILIDCDKPSYKEPPKEISYFAYKKINHFNCWSGTVGIYILMMWNIEYIWNIIWFYI